MSRTRKGAKSAGWEFWSRRPGRGRGVHAKRFCIRTERQQGKRTARSINDEHDPH
jgi:hypothetical protein